MKKQIKIIIVLIRLKRIRPGKTHLILVNAKDNCVL